MVSLESMQLPAARYMTMVLVTNDVGRHGKWDGVLGICSWCPRSVGWEHTFVASQLQCRIRSCLPLIQQFSYAVDNIIFRGSKPGVMIRYEHRSEGRDTPPLPLPFPFACGYIMALAKGYRTGLRDAETWAMKKNPNLLSIESWLVNRDPYNSLL